MVPFHPAAEPVNADSYFFNAVLMRWSGDSSNAVSYFLHAEKINTHEIKRAASMLK
jgi:hypothetical protein